MRWRSRPKRIPRRKTRQVRAPERRRSGHRRRPRRRSRRSIGHRSCEAPLMCQPTEGSRQIRHRMASGFVRAIRRQRSRAMWLESIRPRPSPLPAGFVVTKGSNMRCRTSERNCRTAVADGDAAAGGLPLFSGSRGSGSTSARRSPRRPAHSPRCCTTAAQAASDRQRR